MNNAGAGKYNLITNTGTDTLWGGSDDDIFTIGGTTQGDADNFDGYGGNDVISYHQNTYFYHA